MNDQPLVSADRVRLDVAAADWREAIRQAAQPLLAAGVITPGYVQAMERTREELGPYFVIVPGVALAHARPEAGALSPAVSIARLARPVAFGHRDNDPVWLVVVLAGATDESHLELLRRLAQFLGDESALAAMRQAATTSDAAAALNGALQSG